MPVAALVFVGCCALYLCTLAPGVVGGDSGELLAAACSRAAPHPPGYPVYILVAKLALALPWGSAARRLNVLSALCHAVAATLSCVAWQRISRSAAVGVVAALLFALLDVSWRYATSADVFALNDALVALLLVLTTCHATCGPARRRLAWGVGLTAGLTLGNHQTALFYLPVVGWLVIGGVPRRARRRMALHLAAAGALGLVPYAIMPWLYDSASPWGWGELTHLEGVLQHILRRDYGTLHLGGAAAHVTPHHALGLWRLWAVDVSRASLGAVPLGLAALGWHFSTLPSASRRLVGAWAGAAAAYALVFFYLADLPVDVPVHVEMQSRFWLQLNLVVAGLAACGLGAWAARARWPAVARGAATGFLGVALLAMNYRHGSSHDQDLFERSGRATLSGLPPRAIVLTRGEHMFNPLRALQACEQLRPDVTVLSVEMMHAPWYRPKALAADAQLRYPGTHLVENAAKVAPPAFGLTAFLQQNLRRPIFQCDHNPIVPPALRQSFRLVPWGLCQQVVAVTAPPPQPDLEASLQIFAALQPALRRPARLQSWEAVMQRQIARAQETVAPQLLLVDGPTTQATKRLQQAIGLYETAAEVVDLAPASVKNLGIAYYRLFASTGDHAAKTKMQRTFAHWLRQQASAPAQLAEPPAARQAVEQLLQQSQG